MAMIDDTIRDFDTLHANFRWAIPAHYNIGVDVSDHQPADALALLCEDHRGRVTRHTFGELSSLSNRLGHALRGLGVAAGDRVAIILAQRAETAIAHVATYKIGAIAVPLSVLFGPEALEYRLGNSRAKVVITDSVCGERVAAMRERLPHLEQIVTCAAPGEGAFWDLLA